MSHEIHAGPLRDELGEMMHQAMLEQEQELLEALLRCGSAGASRDDLLKLASALGIKRAYIDAVN